MLRYLLTIFFLTILSISSAQKKLVIDQRFNGNAYYGGASIQLPSFSEVPITTQVALLRFLKETLGSLATQAKFSHGQAIELYEGLPSDNLNPGNQPGRTKYDLNFLLQDTTIGIKAYYLRVRVDEYNQIKSINWPRKNHNDPAEFKSPAEVLAFALTEASKNNLSSENYQVDFKYNEKHDKLCWIFEFQAFSSEASQAKFNTIKIDWKELAVVEKGIMFRFIR